MQKSCVQAEEMQNSCVRADGWKKSCVQADGSKISCVRVDGSEKSCVQAEDAQKSCGRKGSCVGVWKNGGAEIIANSQRNRNCQDADVKPIVRDPMDDDRILIESGTEMTLFHMSLPSSRNWNISSLTSHFNHGAHHVNSTPTNTAHTELHSTITRTRVAQVVCMHLCAFVKQLSSTCHVALAFVCFHLLFLSFPLTSRTPTIILEHDEHSGPDERSHCEDLRQSGSFTQTVTPFHHASKAKHNRKHTNEQSASSKTANSQ